MKHKTSVICCLLAGMLVGANGFAEEYNFEIGLAFDSTRFEGSNTITTTDRTVFNSEETDTDDLSVLGSWYFAGLSDDKGPRARAVLVDRASSLSIGYSHTEQTTSTILTSDDPSFPFPIDRVDDSDGDTFAVNLRYVDRDSGWFGNAGLFSSNTTLYGYVAEWADATGWSLGGGKYLFETTTLGLDVGQIDGDGGSDATVVAVTFSHLGNLGERWQYAIDLGYSRTDADFDTELDTWDATFALYPTQDFEFGIAIQDVSDSSDTLFFSLDSTAIEGFASWYVTPNVSLSARYRVDDVDYLGNYGVGGVPPVSETDQSSFGISATVRF